MLDNYAINLSVFFCLYLSILREILNSLLISPAGRNLEFSGFAGQGGVSQWEFGLNLSHIRHLCGDGHLRDFLKRFVALPIKLFEFTTMSYQELSVPNYKIWQNEFITFNHDHDIKNKKLAHFSRFVFLREDWPTTGGGCGHDHPSNKLIFPYLVLSGRQYLAYVIVFYSK